MATTVEITPFEEMASAAMTKQNVPAPVQDAITKLMSPSADVPWRGLPDNNKEPIAPLKDIHTYQFSNGLQLPFASTIKYAYQYISNAVQPTWVTLTSPGFTFLPDKDSRWNLAIMIQPTLLSHGWFRMEYYGRLSAADANSQQITLTGPIPTTNPALTDLFETTFCLFGQNGTGGPSCVVNFYQIVTDVKRVKRFAAKMRVACSSMTAVQNVDSFYDGGVCKQAVWGCEHRLRGEKVVLVNGDANQATEPLTEGSPDYRWDGLQVDTVYTGGTNKNSWIIQDLAAFMSQSSEYTSAPLKDALTGGAYSIWRTNGEFTDADICSVDNPLAVPFGAANDAAYSKLGNSSYTFQPSRAPVTITTFTNLHPSCLLDLTLRQFSEIVPALGSPVNPWSNKTPLVKDFDELYKEASVTFGRCNPASANDLGTLWKKVRSFFDEHRDILAGAASMVPEFGAPLAAVVKSAPYSQSYKDRNKRKPEVTTVKDAEIQQLTSRLASAGIGAKRVGAKKSATSKKPVTFKIPKKMPKLRRAR